MCLSFVRSCSFADTQQPTLMPDAFMAEKGGGVRRPTTSVVGVSSRRFFEAHGLYTILVLISYVEVYRYCVPD